MSAFKSLPQVLICAFLCAIGFLANWFKVSLFFNVDCLFGSLFSMLTIAIIGGPCGIIGLEPVVEQSLALSGRDDGVGLPPDFNMDSADTLGIRLITGLVAQMGGQLKVETPQENGVSFCEIFPPPENTKIGV